MKKPTQEDVLAACRRLAMESLPFLPVAFFTSTNPPAALVRFDGAAHPALPEVKPPEVSR